MNQFTLITVTDILGAQSELLISEETELAYHPATKPHIAEKIDVHYKTGEALRVHYTHEDGSDCVSADEFGEVFTALTHAESHRYPGMQLPALTIEGTDDLYIIENAQHIGCLTSPDNQEVLAVVEGYRLPKIEKVDYVRDTVEVSMEGDTTPRFYFESEEVFEAWLNYHYKTPSNLADGVCKLHTYEEVAKAVALAMTDELTANLAVAFSGKNDRQYAAQVTTEQLYEAVRLAASPFLFTVAEYLLLRLEHDEDGRMLQPEAFASEELAEREGFYWEDEIGKWLKLSE